VCLRMKITVDDNTQMYKRPKYCLWRVICRIQIEQHFPTRYYCGPVPSTTCRYPVLSILIPLITCKANNSCSVMWRQLMVQRTQQWFWSHVQRTRSTCSVARQLRYHARRCILLYRAPTSNRCRRTCCNCWISSTDGCNRKPISCLLCN